MPRLPYLLHGRSLDQELNSGKAIAQRFGKSHDVTTESSAQILLPISRKHFLKEIRKTSFFGTTCMAMCLACSTIQVHTGMQTAPKKLMKY